jgi:ring-1,2-phenylacetyl-CoA epoxidase subunit PaaE
VKKFAVPIRFALPESGELRIAVKAVKNGVFSQFANTKLKVGKLLK